MQILVVDDDPQCLEILTLFLTDENWDVIQATNGKDAVQLFDENPSIDIVLLDRMMPGMDGMEVLSALKKTDRFKYTPVIMLTGASANDQIINGIENGVYYYLTKPFEKDILLSIIKAAARNAEDYKSSLSNSIDFQHSLKLLEEINFKFRNLDEARDLCIFSMKFFTHDMQFYTGFWELLTNSIIHGNLDIDSQNKNELIVSGDWENYLKERLENPKYCNKYAALRIQKRSHSYFFEVTDQGKGFDWKEMMNNLHQNIVTPYGRGIMIAKKIFPTIQYRNQGTIVSFETEMK